ncbi:MAG: VWA domain-containing protein [bacterium]|nr:VWA domain-containing protein [bacterium]
MLPGAAIRIWLAGVTLAVVELPSAIATPSSRPQESTTAEVAAEPSPIDFGSVPILEGRAPGIGVLEPEKSGPMVDTALEETSMWPIDSSGAAYALSRWYIDHGRLPPAGAIRPGGFASAFDQGDPTPRSVPLSLTAQLFPSPVRAGFHVLKIDLRAAHTDRPAADVVAIVEVSGTDALELAASTLRHLARALGERDRLGLVAHGGRGRTVLEPVSSARRSDLERALRDLQPTSRPSLREGLRLGYAMLDGLAETQRSRRIFLISDGSLGSSPGVALFAEVRRQAERGRLLSAFALPNATHDAMTPLERLTRWGDGRTAVIDHPGAIQGWLTTELEASLQLTARDVVCSVELDPEAVARYRLLGDAAIASVPGGRRFEAEDLGSGDSATVFYEVRLAMRHRLRLGTVHTHYREPGNGESSDGGLRRLETILAPRSAPRAPSTALLPWIAASFGEKLVGSYWARDTSYSRLLRTFRLLEGEQRTAPETAELRYLVLRARDLDRRRQPAAQNDALPVPFEHLRILE